MGSNDLISPAQPSRAETRLAPGARSGPDNLAVNAVSLRGGPFGLKRARVKEHRLSENTIGLVCRVPRAQEANGAPCFFPTPGGVRGRTIIEHRTRVDPSKLARFLLPRRRCQTYSAPSELACCVDLKKVEGRPPATCDGCTTLCLHHMFLEGMPLRFATMTEGARIRYA